MKIAIVNQHPTDMLGGSEIQCDIIARTLVEFGHEVDYIAVGGHDCDAYEVPYRVRPVARQAKAIAEQVIAAKPDVLYWRFNKHCFAKAAQRIKQAGIPIVFSVSHVRDVSRFYLQPGTWRSGGCAACDAHLKKAGNFIGSIAALTMSMLWSATTRTTSVGQTFRCRPTFRTR